MGKKVDMDMVAHFSAFHLYEISEEKQVRGAMWE